MATSHTAHPAGHSARTSRNHGYSRMIRNALGALWLVCSAVVLGIAAYFEKNVSLVFPRLLSAGGLIAEYLRAVSSSLARLLRSSPPFEVPISRHSVGSAISLCRLLLLLLDFSTHRADDRTATSGSDHGRFASPSPSPP